jgi:hypothetical protein
VLPGWSACSSIRGTSNTGASEIGTREIDTRKLAARTRRTVSGGRKNFGLSSGAGWEADSCRGSALRRRPLFRYKMTVPALDLALTPIRDLGTL